MKIQTQRLLLRALQPADAAGLALLAGDFDVARMTGTIPYPYSEQQATDWIGRVYAGEEGEVFAIERAGVLIGCTGYRAHDAEHAEIGYWLGKPYWGYGYATEAALRMIDDAFGRFGFDYLIGGHFDDNLASARVLSKLGFVAAGEEMRHCAARDLEQRTLLYRLDRASVTPKTSSAA